MQNAIISDTSCLILLDNINELNILQLLFGTVIITSEIKNEFKGSLPDWIVIKNPDDERQQKILENTIDKGEASAIALAIELGNALLILDDKKARNIAAERGNSFVASKNTNMLRSFLFHLLFRFTKTSEDEKSIHASLYCCSF